MKNRLQNADIVNTGNTIRCNVFNEYVTEKIVFKITRITGMNKPILGNNSQVYIHGITPEGKKVKFWVENMYNEELVEKRA